MRLFVEYQSYTISKLKLKMYRAHVRLIDLVAEDNAIEDTIYHMTRALDNERIDLDRFLKVSSSVIPAKASLYDRSQGSSI